ncbi:MAG: hypothetical protein CL674_00825 [Bdellovibrionaceae bacterium]|nr:hypothetical protein [Pseudobdellovibrionaceae bacterium]
MLPRKTHHKKRNPINFKCFARRDIIHLKAFLHLLLFPASFFNTLNVKHVQKPALNPKLL